MNIAVSLCSNKMRCLITVMRWPAFRNLLSAQIFRFDDALMLAIRHITYPHVNIRLPAASKDVTHYRHSLHSALRFLGSPFNVTSISELFACKILYSFDYARFLPFC